MEKHFSYKIPGVWGGASFQKSCLKKALSRRKCLFISSPDLVHTCTHIHKAVVKTKTICYPPASNSFKDFPHFFFCFYCSQSLLTLLYCCDICQERGENNKSFSFHRSHVCGGFRRAQLLLVWQDKFACFAFLLKEKPPSPEQ